MPLHQMTPKSNGVHLRENFDFLRTNMTATTQRDQVISLAKTNPAKALVMARDIRDPWFRAQALSWVARFSGAAAAGIADEAARAASECEDDYKRSAVRAWEIAALAELAYTQQAKAALRDATKTAQCAEPPSSRAEALLLLLQAAFLISRDDAMASGNVLTSSCSASDHWRCKRALKVAAQMLEGKFQPRPFFW